MTRNSARSFLPSSFLRSLLLLFFVSLVVAIAILLLPESADHRLTEARQLVADWELPQAERLLEELSLDNPSLDVTRLSADVALKRGNLKKSRALHSFLLGRDSAQVPRHTINLAFTHYYLGNLDSAMILALRVAGQKDSIVSARAFNLLGLIDFNRAKYREAWEHQARSLAIARGCQDPQGEADALRQLGVLEWYQARHDAALAKYYQPALEIYQRIGDKIGEATTLSNMGLIHLDQAEWVKEVAYQLKAFAIRKRIGDLRGIADSYYFLSTSGILSKGKTFSYTYRMKSLELSTNIGYAWGREVAARSIEDLLKDQPWFADRLGQFQDSVLLMSGEGKLYQQLYAARRFALERRWWESTRHYEDVIRISDSLRYVIGRNVAYKEYGVALMGEGRYREAEAALKKCRALTTPKPYAYTDNELGELYLLTGRPRRAQQMLLPVVRNLDSTYAQALHETSPSRFFGGSLRSAFLFRARAYELLLSTLRNSSDSETFKIIEQERALPFWGERRSISEQSQTALGTFIRTLEHFDDHPEKFQNIAETAARVGELQQEMAAEQAMYSRSSPETEHIGQVSLTDLRQSLGPGELFIEYAIGYREIVLFCATKEGANVLRRAMDVDQLRSRVETLRESILRGKDDPSDNVWMASAASLYRDLLLPVSRVMKGKNHIIVSPHQFLDNVPFHALVDPLNRPVIDDAAFSYMPSAAFLVKSRERPMREAKTLVALAPQTSLSFSQQEVDGIPQDMFTATTVLKGPRASAENLLAAFREADVTHIASHTRMNVRFPFYSYIESADRRVELHEILRSTVSAKLVFLSACESGQNVGAIHDELTSENNVSFPLALISAGASTVIASSWLVDDESTAFLSSCFYGALKSASPSLSRIPQCLAIAQRQLILKSALTGKPSHPFFWAPFSVVGDSR